MDSRYQMSPILAGGQERDGRDDGREGAVDVVDEAVSPERSLSEQYTTYFNKHSARASHQRVLQDEPTDYQGGMIQHDGSPSEAGFDDADHEIISPRKRASWLRWWKVELIACIISVLAFIALIIVLVHFNNRPQSNIGLPQDFQLNTLIAQLSTIIRVAFMVPVAAAISQENWLWASGSGGRSRFEDLQLTDSASRGSFGSLVFLYKRRKRYLACIGAIISVLSLVFSTFTQQLISLELAANDETLGNIPRIQVYNFAVTDSINGHVDVEADFKAAAYTGLFSTVQPSSVTCSTSNCSWPLSPTLGICGACANTTKSLAVSCPSHATSTSASVCNYTVPSGNVFRNTSSLSDIMRNGNGSVYSAADVAYFANFDILDFEDGCAFECALWACVQAYSVKVTAGTTVQSYSPMASQGVFVDGVAPYYNGNFTISIDLNASFPEHRNVTGARDYRLDEVSYNGIRLFLEEFWTGNATGGVGGGEGSYSNDYDLVIFGVIGERNADEPGLTTWIENLALSLTNDFRTNGESDDARYDGTAYTLHVKVVWAWLTLPVALVVLSLLYSGITIVRTARAAQRSGVEAWKGDVLNMLISDVEPSVRHVARGDAVMHQPGGLMDAIGSMTAVLGRSQGGRWIFGGSAA